MANNATIPMDSFVYVAGESTGDDRNVLPQLRGGAFLTDCGLDTAFQQRNFQAYPLRDFQDRNDGYCEAAFMLLRTRSGRQWLKRYYRSHVNAALSINRGFILETPTLRANPDRAWELDVSLLELEDLDRAAVELARSIAVEFADEFAARRLQLLISGCIGPRHDDRNGQPGVMPSGMTIVEAMEYHGRQIAAFARAGADFVTATEMTQCDEAIGIVRAARAAGLPVVVSFDIGGDGRLISGRSLGDAITTVDAATGSAPAYYAVRCEHPSDAARALESQSAWVRRVRGLGVAWTGQADLASELVRRQGRGLLQRHSHINVLGGGTSSPTIEETAKACAREAHAMTAGNLPRPWSNQSWIG